MIVLKNVDKEFKDHTIFKDLNLVLEPNKRNLVVGSNGVGKSVLLKIISGFSRPKNGTVSVEEGTLGTDFDFLPSLGVSLNHPEFMNHWTGYENLKYLATIQNMIEDQTFIDLAAALYLTKKDLHKKYKKYSEGMKQKMRIIQAMMENPKYLILDEPFNALDQDSVESVKNLLDAFVAKPDKYLIITSHDRDSLEYADVIIKIQDGTVSREEMGFKAQTPA